jgi:hypothetical protein
LKTLLPEDQARRTLELVVDLTDVYIKKDYPQLNRRERKAKEQMRLERTSADSQTIKYADIIDNSVEIVKYDPGFARIFLVECRSNLQKLTLGHKELFHEAIAIVNNSIASLNEKQSISRSNKNSRAYKQS